LGIRLPMALPSLGVVLRETVRRNRVTNGTVYLQVTRGAAPRNPVFPSPEVNPTVVAVARSIDPAAGEKRAADGVAVLTMPDDRWERVDIKTTGLLPNVLAKNKARSAGAFEAWLVDRDGYVTEGASSNAWIVTAKGQVVTRPADHDILRGVTRSVVIDLAGRLGLSFEERPFKVSEAFKAKEAFMTAASAIVTPVVRIDGKPIGDGKPGKVASELRAHFHEQAEIASEFAGPIGKIDWPAENRG